MQILKKFPEKSFPNFYSNRGNADIVWELQEIFKDEFNLIHTKYNNKISVNIRKLMFLYTQINKLKK